MEDGTILLIEDNEDHIELTVDVFDSIGLSPRLRVVKTGEAAIDYLFRKNNYTSPVSAPRPEVIFLDMKLPRLSGLEVLERIKTHPELKAIPVIIYTTSMNHEDLEKSMQLGATDYLIKPARSETVCEKLTSIKYRTGCPQSSGMDNQRMKY